MGAQKSIDEARSFVNAKKAAAPWEKMRDFLENKGLTPDEIDEAIRRAGFGEAAFGVATDENDVAKERQAMATSEATMTSEADGSRESTGEAGLPASPPGHGRIGLMASSPTPLL